VCAKRERIRSREKAGGEDDGSAAIYILSSRRPGERLTDSDSIGTSLLVLSVWAPDSVSATPRCFSLLGSRFARPRPTDSDFLCKKKIYANALPLFTCLESAAKLLEIRLYLKEGEARAKYKQWS
jgi:hypothetical protein